MVKIEEVELGKRSNFVWAGKKMEWWPWTGEVYYTRNKGQTWTKSTGFVNNNF